MQYQIVKPGNCFRKLLLFIAGIFIYMNSYGQGKYIPAYIIQLNGDTVHGFIEYKGWGRNPENILFKEKIEGELTQYFPMGIKGFSVNDEFYESAIIKTETSPGGLSELKADAGLKIKIDTAFLQVLIKGPKCLLYYMNSTGKEQFYIKQDQVIELLVYKKYIKETEQDDLVMENKKFIGQLSYYFKDSPSIQSKISGSEYKKNSLIKIFLSYYSSTGTKVVFQKKTKRVPAEFGVFAGLSITSIAFKGDGFPELTSTVYPSSANFSCGSFYNVYLPDILKNWSSENELILSSYKVKGTYMEYKNVDWYTIYDTKFAYTYLKMNNMLRYNFPIGVMTAHVNVGISNGIVVRSLNYMKKEVKFYVDNRVEESVALKETDAFEQGYVFGCGTKYKRYSLDIRYEISGGMSKYSALGSQTKRWYFLLGYRF